MTVADNLLGLFTLPAASSCCGMYEMGCACYADLSAEYLNLEHYFNLSGEKTLRRYSHPVNLKRFDHIPWMTAKRDVWEIPEYLCTIAHRDLLPQSLERPLSRVDKRSFTAGRIGSVK